MTLKNRLFEILPNDIKEAVESSKDMIDNNVVSSFNDMSMADLTPGEFAQDEITDHENLVNKANMANDNDFGNDSNCKEDTGLCQNVLNMLDDIVDISAPAEDSTVEIIQSTDAENSNEDEAEESHLHKHIHFGESSFGKIIEKFLNGKTCEEFLTESNYAGPRDYTPDLRISTADVLNALKNKIGKGAEAIHVDQEYDENKNNMYRVSQIKKDLLPSKLQVENVLLELDGDCYKLNKPSDSFPLSK